MDIIVKLRDVYELDGKRYEPTGEPCQRIAAGAPCVEGPGCDVFAPLHNTEGLYFPLREIVDNPPMPTPEQVAAMRFDGKRVELLLVDGKPVCRVPVDGELSAEWMRESPRFGGRRWIVRVVEPKYRPLNGDELKALVGQVIVNELGRSELVTVFDPADGTVKTDRSWINAAGLLRTCVYPDTGKPVGVEVE